MYKFPFDKETVLFTDDHILAIFNGQEKMLEVFCLPNLNNANTEIDFIQSLGISILGRERREYICYLFVSLLHLIDSYYTSNYVSY